MEDELLQTFVKYFFKILVIYGSLVFLTIKAKNVPLKIVEEPAVYRGVNSYYQQHQSVNSKVLEPRVEPIPFSGPPHLVELNGKCFSLTENGYKYELCPFHNITQREQTVRWNAFSGILGCISMMSPGYGLWQKDMKNVTVASGYACTSLLGVYQGWVIVNNTFDSMLMNEGDLCPGSNPRQTKVYFRCGEQHGILSVSEPRTCHYHMEFQTPLACPVDALLVYPVLSPKGQTHWESIEEDLWREEITLQGYTKRRRKLFMSEGLVALDEKGKDENLQSKDKKERKNEKKGENVQEKKKFLTIEQCSNAYDELYAEVERLRKLVIPFGKLQHSQSEGKKNNSASDIIATTSSINTANKDNAEYEVLRFGNRTTMINGEIPATLDQEEQKRITATANENIQGDNM